MKSSGEYSHLIKNLKQNVNKWSFDKMKKIKHGDLHLSSLVSFSESMIFSIFQCNNHSNWSSQHRAQMRIFLLIKERERRDWIYLSIDYRKLWKGWFWSSYVSKKNSFLDFIAKIFYSEHHKRLDHLMLNDCYTTEEYSAHLEQNKTREILIWVVK